MIRTLAAASAAVVLAACSSAVVPHAAHTSSSMPTRDRVYLKVMRDQPAWAHLSDSTLLGARRETCQQFANGESWLGLVAFMTKQAGFSGRDAGFAIAAAVRTGCPQFLSLLP
jgi:hypothetical protein